MVGDLQKHKVHLTPPSCSLLFVLLKATVHTCSMFQLGYSPSISFLCCLSQIVNNSSKDRFSRRETAHPEYRLQKLKQEERRWQWSKKLYLLVIFRTCSSSMGSISTCFAFWGIKNQARALLLGVDNCTLHATYTGALFAYKFTALPESNSSSWESLSLPAI